MPRNPRPYSKLTCEAMTLLAGQISLGRKRYRMTQQELASRMNVNRRTVQMIEKGAPTVAVGLVLEAATLTGVDLFVPEATTLAPQIERTRDKLALMPHSIRNPHTAPGHDPNDF